MKEVLLVGIGGFAGTIARYGINLWIKGLTEKTFIATIIVNLVGCFLLGLISGGFLKLNQTQSLLMAVGLCGGFTTFSTFAYDGIKMLKAGLHLQFASYFLISTVGGLILCFVGFALINK